MRLSASNIRCRKRDTFKKRLFLIIKIIGGDYQRCGLLVKNTASTIHKFMLYLAGDELNCVRRKDKAIRVHVNHTILRHNYITHKKRLTYFKQSLFYIKIFVEYSTSCAVC